MAEAAEVFNAQLGVTDLVSGPLKRIVGSIKGLDSVARSVGPTSRAMASAMRLAFGTVDRAAQGAGKAVRKVSHEIEAAPKPNNWLALAGHIRLMRGNFHSLGASIEGVHSKLTGLIPVLGGLGGMGSVAGIFATVDKVSARVAEARKTSKSLGMDPGQLGRFTFTAKMTDIDPEAMTAGLGKLSSVIGNAVRGKNKDAAALFQKLGISLKDAHGNILSAAEALPKLANAFAHTKSEAMQNAMAVALFGKGGRELIPLLAQGSGALEAYGRQAKEVNYAFTSEESENLEKYHQSMTRLGSAVTGVTNAVGAKLAPVLQPVIDQFTDWISANRDWIASGISDAIKRLADWLKELKWDDVKRAIDDARIAGEAFAALWVASKIGVMVSNIGKITGAVRALSGEIRAVPPLKAPAGVPSATGAPAATKPQGGPRRLPVAALAGGLLGIGLDLYNRPPEELGLNKRRPEDDPNSPDFRFFEKGSPAARLADWMKSQFSTGDTNASGAAPIAGTGAGAASSPPPPLAPYALGAMTPAAGANPYGQMKVQVEFKNAPPGTAVQASASGGARQPDVDVGYSQAGVAGAF